MLLFLLNLNFKDEVSIVQVVLRRLNTDLTPRNPSPKITTFERLTLWFFKLVAILNSCQPEGVFIGKVVTCPSSSVTLDKRCGSEML